MVVGRNAYARTTFRVRVIVIADYAAGIFYSDTIACSDLIGSRVCISRSDQQCDLVRVAPMSTLLSSEGSGGVAPPR